MKIVRLVGFALAAVAAVVVFVAFGPDDATRIDVPVVEGLEDLLEQAISDYDENKLGAGDNAELQIVTNGWVARDLLFILVRQVELASDQLSALSTQLDGIAAASDADDRVPALLLIGILTTGFHWATAPFGAAGSLGAQRVVSGRRTAVPARSARPDRTDASVDDDEDED